MDIFGVVTMIGGLALFLYGMNTMGSGLERLSGGKLEKILEKLTSNKYKAVFLGLFVTAIIQSSSATTVMVVGFVNSGIMKLGQAVGVIMGANIGTTVTSWILSLTGIQSENFLLKFLKPANFSPILALVGVILIMFIKDEKKKTIGNILIGFAILMYGMETMTNAVAPLKDVPEFTNLLLMFSNPVLGMLAGTILTAIIQSSSASVGILQALCLTGAVSFGTALPIIMGQNIGTCITAILSSFGTNKNAKRAAAVHLYFNVIGTVTFMIIFYTLNAFVHFNFLEEVATPAGIAIIHSLFNIAATLCLLPLSGLLEKLATLTIPDREQATEEEFKVLDVRFLDTPSFGIQQCKKVAETMAAKTKQAIFTAMDLIGNYNEEKAKEVAALENQIDTYEDEIGSYLVKLSSKNLSKKDSHNVSMMLHCIGDFERIGDHAMNIVEVAKELNVKELSFSEKADTELEIYSRSIIDILTTAVDVFESEDIKKAKTVEPLEEVVDYLNAELKSRHINRLLDGKCTIELGFILSDIITNYERIADHCSNIAVAIIQTQEEGVNAHEYIDALKQEDNEEFQAALLHIKQNYVLP